MNETKGWRVSQSDQYGGLFGEWHLKTTSAKNAQECNQSQAGVKVKFISVCSGAGGKNDKIKERFA